MKKKIKKKYLKWLRVVFLLYQSSFEILIHFKPMTWQHLEETAVDSWFVEPTWNKHPYLHLVKSRPVK